MFVKIMLDSNQLYPDVSAHMEHTSVPGLLYGTLHIDDVEIRGISSHAAKRIITALSRALKSPTDPEAV